MITGIFETHLNVTDLTRSANFYENIIGLELAHTDSRGARFYWVGGRGKAMLGLWEKEPAKVFRQHFAFEVPLSQLNLITEELIAKGVQVTNFTDNGTSEPYVFGWMPAVSVYAEDPDGHSLEWIAMLPDDPKPEAGVVPWKDWEKWQGR
ncbi:VOC family protein [Neobacillus mesonae]|nr:VOC family protein [Neobacillus mesonae]